MRRPRLAGGDWSRAGADEPLGGRIALGHPLGATGARLMTTLLHTLHRDGIGTASR